MPLCRRAWGTVGLYREQPPAWSRLQQTPEKEPKFFIRYMVGEMAMENMEKTQQARLDGQDNPRGR